MRRMGLIAALWAGATAASAAPLPEPIAKADQGLLQCYAPNPTHKTCQSLASYAQVDGAILNRVVILLAPNPLIIMTATSPVQVAAGQVCGPIRSEDLAAATFTIAGQPATADQTARLRQKLQASMAGLIGRKACMTYVADGPALIAKSTIDGVAQPSANQPVIWVSPAQGYTVGP